MDANESRFVSGQSEDISPAPQPVPAYTVPASAGRRFDRAGKWAVPCAWLLGFFYTRLLFDATVNPIIPGLADALDQHGVELCGHRVILWPAALVFTLLYCGAVITLCRARGQKAGTSGFWLGCLLVTALAVTFGRMYAVDENVAVLLWHGLALYWTLARTGQLSGGETGCLCVPDVLRGVGMGFAGLGLWPADVLRLLLRPRRKRRFPVTSVLVVAAAIVLLAVAGGLLGQADSGFAGLLDRIAFWKDIRFDKDWWGMTLLEVFLALFVGAFFYGFAVCGAEKAEASPRPAPETLAPRLERTRTVSPQLLCGVCAAFCLLYLLFFGVQTGYLFGGFVGRLPEGFTVAEYARQGFFELCAVMALNLTVLAGADALAKGGVRGGTTLCTAATVLLAESLLLWATAAAKLGLYISVFGFTPRRLQAAWALLVLAVAAVTALVSLYRRCAVVRPTVLVGAASLSLLCLV